MDISLRDLEASRDPDRIDTDVDAGKQQSSAPFQIVDFLLISCQKGNSVDDDLNDALHLQGPERYDDEEKWKSAWLISLLAIMYPLI